MIKVNLSLKKLICYSAIPAFLLIYLIVYYLMVLFCSDGVKTSETITKTTDVPVVIIDPGHGGVDGGAVSASGILEKDVNLKIAKYINNYCKLSGVECILTRQEDISLVPKQNMSSSRKRSDLIARAEIAGENPDSIFISIHQNTFPSSRYSGLQVFYSKNNGESLKIAEQIKNSNKEMLDNDNERQLKAAGEEIYILNTIKSPAVLIECGFLSNAEEASMLATEEYQKELAFMIYTAIMRYIYLDSGGIV